MDLILWRHAEAHVLKDGQTDLERMLTAKGERQAQRMAEWLNRRLVQSTKVLASPAARTQDTAKALGRKFRTHDALAPDAGVDSLLQAARWPFSAEPVLIVGHQPTLGLLASQLLAGDPLPWSIQKGAVWWLRHRQRDGLEQVVLQAVQGPDCL